MHAARTVRAVAQDVAAVLLLQSLLATAFAWVGYVRAGLRQTAGKSNPWSWGEYRSKRGRFPSYRIRLNVDCAVVMDALAG